MKLQIEDLSKDELQRLIDQLQNQIFKLKESDIIIEMDCFHDGKFVCNHCESHNTRKAGKTPQGKQRYYCKECGKYTIAEKHAVNHSSKKAFSQWVIFIQSMLDGDPLTISADKANISKRTAFRWRHKILDVLNKRMNTEILEGEVYLDETLIPVVHKDNNPATPNKSEEKKRGMSDQKVNVTCAIDQNNKTIMRVVDTGRVTSKSLIKTYDGKLKQGSIVISDSCRSYHKLMRHLDIVWKKIPSKKKSVEHYTLDPINHLHANIKDFLLKYKGVSIKYLQGYIALFELQRNYKYHHRVTVFDAILSIIFTGTSTLKCSDIDKGLHSFL